MTTMIHRMRKFYTLLLVVGMVLGGQIVAHAQDASTPLIFDVRWSGQWIGASSTDGLWLFDSENPEAEPLHYLAGHSVPTLAFDPIRPRVAVFDDLNSYVRILDLESGESIEDIYIETPPEDFFPVVYDMQYSDDGKLLVVTTGARLHVIEGSTSRRRDSFHFPSSGSETRTLEWVTSVDFGRQPGDIIAGNINRHLLFFNIASQNLGDAAALESSVYRLEVIPDSDDLLIMQQGLSVYRSETGDVALLDPKFEIGVYGFDLNAAGDLVAAGMDGVYVLYSLTEGAMVREVMTNDLGTERVFGLAFSDDGTQLVTLDTAGRITIWDVASGEVVAELGDFSRAVSYKWG